MTLKFFAAMVDANKLERALDLVHRLHLEVSYNLACQLAARHDRLVDAIERARDVKFAEDTFSNNEELDHGRDSYDHSSEPIAFMDRITTSQQISPDATPHTRLHRGNLFQTSTKKQRLT